MIAGLFLNIIIALLRAITVLADYILMLWMTSLCVCIHTVTKLRGHWLFQPNKPHRTGGNIAYLLVCLFICLVTPWWPAAVYPINPSPPVLADVTWAKPNIRTTRYIHQKTFFFTDAIKTEGRVYVVWDAIPGVTNKSGEARVHCLPVFIVSVHIGKELSLIRPSLTHTHTHTTHTFSWQYNTLFVNILNSTLAQLLWFRVQIRSH